MLTAKTPRSLIAAALLACALCPLATVAAADDPKPADPMAGPSVPAAAQKRTLVERDVDGKLKRLDRAPAEAAVRLLNLSAEVQKQVDEIITQRAAILDTLVADHLREVVEIAGAAQAGDRAEAARKMKELAPYARPLRDRGTLGQELGKVLPEGQARQLRDMTQEYMQALIKEETDAAIARGEALDEQEIMKEEMVRLVGQEVRRSYERVVGQQSADFDKLIQSLSLSEAQEGQVRKIIGDLFTQNYGKATAAQKATAFGEVWKLLTSEQRAEMLKEMRARRGDIKAQDPPEMK